MRLVITAIITSACLSAQGCNVPGYAPYSEDLITGSIAPADVPVEFCADCETFEMSEEDLPDH